jgi:hypothetical protein
MSTQQWSLLLAGLQVLIGALFWFGIDAKVLKNKVGEMTPRNKLVTILIVGSFLFSGFGFYKTLEAPRIRILDPDLIIAAWGMHPPGVMTAVIATEQLQPFKENFRVMLAVRVTDNTVDPKKDKTVEKSSLFLITGGPIPIEIPMSQDMKGRINTSAASGKVVAIEYYALMVPKGVQPRQITALADVDTLGGNILARRRAEH